MIKFVLPETTSNSGISRIRENLMDVMRDQVIKVTFNKVDGTVRTMNTTLNIGLIPFECQPQLKHSTESDNEEVIRCFEVDLQAWRSFRVDSIIEVMV